ncbi:MAG TPA: heme exporter protein CcmB [Pyrinomonadaceae bacterium]|jgi:heme exporter protein B|nr:heme exporter protein CcmB [Pyrinomonadaceae bacterium]
MTEASVQSMFGWLVWRDLILAWRRRADVLATVFFFIIVTSLFPLGIGPERETLRTIAPGVVWVAALLASMLSLGRIFGNDYQDGTLEQLILTPQSTYLMVLAKVLAHWVVSEIPLVVIAPVLGLQFGLSQNTLLTVMVSLLLGTPVLSVIGSIGAALTLGLRAANVLVALLVLPLYIPVLIFGSGAVQATVTGTSPQAWLLLLGATLIVSLVFAPWATSAALKISVE